VAAARNASFTSSTVTSRLAAVGAKGFRRLRSAHPDAIVQCPVDFLGPLVLAAPRRARAVLRMLAGWGISRFSVACAQDTTLSLVQALQGWGYNINLYAVPDHESFLHAVLLLPRSLTADFNSRSGTIMGGARVNDGVPPQPDTPVDFGGMKTPSHARQPGDSLDSHVPPPAEPGRLGCASHHRTGQSATSGSSAPSTRVSASSSPIPHETASSEIKLWRARTYIAVSAAASEDLRWRRARFRTTSAHA
jgi:hypothetical protein